MDLSQETQLALNNLAFYASPAHECSYLPDRQAVTLFADPSAEMDTLLYTALVDFGFRRSGAYVYRPACPGCAACLSVRIPVAEFTPNRSERRTWRRNEDLTVQRTPATFRQEAFDLYRHYLGQRHAGGGMDDPSPEKYLHFLTSPWSDTFFYEFRLAGRLVAVAVVDQLLHGVSAVYTFYDPALSDRGLGTFAILWEIEQAKRQGLPYLYLGYWVEECSKMSYKGRFRPLEIYRNGRWEGLAGNNRGESGH